MGKSSFARNCSQFGQRVIPSMRKAPQAPPKPPEAVDFDEGGDWGADWDAKVALAPPCDSLSKITEGSNESLVSSVFFSAVSGGTSRPSKRSSKCAVGGSMPALLTNVCRGLGMPGTLPTPSRASARPSPRTSKLQSIQEHKETPDLRQVVKGFVESAVRGILVEALCSTGCPRSVIFQLNRKVDAFDLTPSGGGASCNISLMELAAVHAGEDAWSKRELGAVVAGLDASCIVLELVDGRCLALRFRGGLKDACEQQANVFSLCMQTFVNELHAQ